MNSLALEQVASVIRAGDWAELYSLLADQSEPAPLLLLLASDDLFDFHDEQAGDILPDYQLRRMLYPCGTAAKRLGEQARRAEAAGLGALAVALYDAALAFDAKDVAAHLALAWRSYGNRDLEKALEHAEAAHSTDAGSADIATALGWILWEGGQGERSLRVLQHALRCDADHIAAHWYLGHINARLGEIQISERHLRKALEIEPGFDEARVTLAWTLADTGKITEALEQARVAADRDPLPHRLAQLGHLLSLSGDLDAARVLLRQALDEAPEDPVIRRRLSFVMARTGEHDGARDLIEEGLRVDPQNPTLLLARATLIQDGGNREQARLAAEEITRRWPDLAEGWHLLGKLSKGGSSEAEALFSRAYESAPDLTAAALDLAWTRLQLHKSAEAAQLMETLISRAPDLAPARRLLAHAYLEEKQPERARAELHRILAGEEGGGAQAWILLSIALQRMNRRIVARLAAARARRLNPGDVEALRHSAALALDMGRIDEAVPLCAALQRLAPDLVDGQILASFALQAAGDTAEAARHAERAVATALDNAEAWRALGNARHHQRRIAEAEANLRQAAALAPDQADIQVALAWVLADDDRLEEAIGISIDACALQPREVFLWQQRADLLAAAGRTQDAVSAARQALELGAVSLSTRISLARQLFVHGTATADPVRSEAWAETQEHLGIVMRRDPTHHDAGILALRLATSGWEPARHLIGLIPSDRRYAYFLEIMEWLAGFGSAEEAGRCAKLARDAFPENAQIEIASLYLHGMSTGTEPGSMARWLREWGLSHQMACGREDIRKIPAAGLGERLRVAYVASHFHHSLLTGVLAAHDHERVEVHLYTNDPAALPPDLGGNVIVHPLNLVSLGESCAANRIEVVVDTVGLHPFHGQAEVLRAFRRRIAPLQCGWLGTWGPGTGLFDIQITDDVAAPQEQEGFYDEALLRLPGGQWHWTPPATAGDVAPLPAAYREGVVFGCDVRGFRISQECLEAWARLLARIPQSRLHLLGRQARDLGFRRRFEGILRAYDIDIGRVSYTYQKPYGRHFRYFDQIDIALDTFPSNGGLCLLDALWMGVPVVTLAGSGLASERQGASILASATCPEWIATDIDGYVDIACALASDLAGLAETRHGLRQRLLASPLSQARRIAGALEDEWFRRRDAIATIQAAEDAKSASRAIARGQLRDWLKKGARLRLPETDAPQISVVVILYNQAGLTLQCLRSLADQQAPAFETIIIDNASGDETGALLDRIDGATIIRNDENTGFLLAANQGAALARGRHILLLNNDAFLHRDALAVAHRRLAADASAGAVGGRIVLGDGRLQEAGCMAFSDGSTVGYGRGQNPAAGEFRFVRPVEFTSGAFLMVRRALWRMLGGFDEAYAPAYYEDADLCFRIRKAGFKVVYDPNILVNHLEWGSAVTAHAATDMMRRNQALFLERHNDLLAKAPLPRDSKPVRDRLAAISKPRILVLDNAVPHQSGGAGQPRARAMMHALQGYWCSFLPLWTLDEDWRDVYATMPEDCEVILGVGASHLEAFLESRAGFYDILLVSRPPNMAVVGALKARRPKLFENLRIVYDAEALFALRDVTKAVLSGTPMKRSEIRRRLRSEIALTKDAECVLAVSAREARLLRSGGACDVKVLSHAGDCRVTTPDWEARDGLLFVGALNPETPNEDSLVWFAEDVLPVLNDMLGEKVPVTVVGSCRSDRVAALADGQVRLVGRIDDLDPVYDRARVFIAPTRYGAGVPLKVIEATLAGVPVVSTRFLVRQLDWSNGTEILGEDDPQAFAGAIAQLYRDGNAWAEMRRSAQLRAARQYSQEAFVRALNGALEGSPKR